MNNKFKNIFCAIILNSPNMFCMEAGKEELALTKFPFFSTFPKEIKYLIIKSFLTLKDKTPQSIIENYKKFILLKIVDKQFHNFLNQPDSKTDLTGYQKIIFNQFSIDDFTKLNKYIFDTVNNINDIVLARINSSAAEIENELFILIEFLIYHNQFDSTLKNCGNNLLELACIKNLQNIVASLLKYKIFDIDSSLIIASSNGYKEIVEMLISDGANTAAKNSDGFTALNLAIDHGHGEIVTILLNAGAKHTPRKSSVSHRQKHKTPKGCSVM